MLLNNGGLFESSVAWPLVWTVSHSVTQKAVRRLQNVLPDPPNICAVCTNADCITDLCFIHIRFWLLLLCE